MIPHVFIVLLAAALLLGVGALLYLWTRFRRFEWLNSLPRRKNMVYAALPAILLAIWWRLSMNGLVVILHLTAMWIVCDLAALCWRKKRGKRYYAGYAALVLTALYLGYGYIACHQVVATHYTLPTLKSLEREKLRIALIADAHLGEIFDGDGFAAHLARIAAEKPDVLVIAGDLVDVGTKRADMERMMQALTEFSAPLGKYYVFGNHDRGFGRRRDFSAEDLTSGLERAGVKVLCDEAVHLSGNVALIGRRDRSEQNRRSAADLLNSIPAESYRLVLDHQPTDYTAEAAAGADLVLSGHTHGGQLWPLGWVSRKTSNDNVYGLVRQGNTDFIVTSGIADWAIAFKTGCISEYVIIDVISSK